MTIDRWYSIGCDNCASTTGILESPSIAWRVAERAGWTRVRSVRRWIHYCPTCLPSVTPGDTP